MGTRGARAIALIIIVVMIVVGYRWWASDERAIRGRMTAIAEALTMTPEEGDLARIGRIATLRDALGPEIVVSVQAAQQIAGRDAVLAVVGRYMAPPGGVTVEFVDVQVTVTSEPATAQVYCTARITTGGATNQPEVDARELRIGFARQDGSWRVISVQPEDTLVR